MMQILKPQIKLSMKYLFSKSIIFLYFQENEVCSGLVESEVDWQSKRFQISWKSFFYLPISNEIIVNRYFGLIY